MSSTTTPDRVSAGVAALAVGIAGLLQIQLMARSCAIEVLRERMTTRIG